jgi:hypothetical protein
LILYMIGTVSNGYWYSMETFAWAWELVVISSQVLMAKQKLFPCPSERHVLLNFRDDRPCLSKALFNRAKGSRSWQSRLCRDSWPSSFPFFCVCLADAEFCVCHDIFKSFNILQSSCQEKLFEAISRKFKWKWWDKVIFSINMFCIWNW